MTILYATCVWLTWAAASNATHYDVFVNRIYHDTVISEVELCDFGRYASHDIYVVGLNDAEEAGPDSNLLVFAWTADFDRNDDGVVGFADFGAFAQAFNSTHPDCLWADADGDGIVGFGDFGFFVNSFGHCNNDTFEVPCG